MNTDWTFANVKESLLTLMPHSHSVIRFFLSSSSLLEIHAEKCMNELKASCAEVKKDI